MVLPRGSLVGLEAVLGCAEICDLRLVVGPHVFVDAREDVAELLAVVQHLSRRALATCQPPQDVLHDTIHGPWPTQDPSARVGRKRHA